MKIIDDFNRILDYIKNFYADYPERQDYDFRFNMKEIIINIEKEESQNQDKEVYTLIDKFIKKILQFLLYNNLIILKSESSTSIRHYFPRAIKTKKRYSVDLDKGLLEVDDSQGFSGKDFYTILKKYFNYNNIKVKINKPKNENKEVNYFSINDYESIIRILLFWDNSDSFIEKVSESYTYLNEFISYKFPNEKITDLREIFRKFDAFLYFDNEYIEQLFGENGLIKKNNLTVKKFLELVSPTSNITRQAVYRWKSKNYLPLSFFIELMKTDYNFDRDFLKHINFLQIGKSSNKISKNLIKAIKSNYENWFINFFPPPPITKLGFIFDYDPFAKDVKLDFLKEYTVFLNNYSKEFLDKYKEVISTIKNKFSKQAEVIYLKSLRMRNFKSFLNETIDFQRGVNILWGLNESGKTTILEAIFFALFIHKPLVHEFKLKRLYPLEIDCLQTHFIHFGKNECEVSLLLRGERRDIEITRKLWKNGKHQIYINNEDIFKNVDIRDYEITIHEPVYNNDFKIENKSLKEKIRKVTSYNIKKIKYVREMDDFLLERGGIEFDIYNIIDEIGFEVKSLNNKFIINKTIASGYINYIMEEISKAYKQINCFFDLRDIYPSFFLEFESISSFINQPNKMLDFFLKSLNLKFIDDLSRENKIETKSVEFTSTLTYFLRDSRDFLFNLFFDVLNRRLTEFSDEYYSDLKFIISHVDYYPTIFCLKNKEKYPIQILSGGERNILILGLFSIFTSISDKNSFYLLDEPSMFLDQVNIEAIKKLFLKLFKNKQLVIATHNESYKNFQPALAYNAWKDNSNASHVFRLRKDKKFFDLISNLLTKYKEIADNSEKEKEIVILIGELLDTQHGVLIDNGFKVLHNGDTIRDKNYMVHLTRKHQNNKIHQFLIRRLDNGSKKNPDEVYHSRGYPDYQIKLNNINVFTNFIKYLKSKK